MPNCFYFLRTLDLRFDLLVLAPPLIPNYSLLFFNKKNCFSYTLVFSGFHLTVCLQVNYPTNSLNLNIHMDWISFAVTLITKSPVDFCPSFTHCPPAVLLKSLLSRLAWSTRLVLFLKTHRCTWKPQFWLQFSPIHGCSNDWTSLVISIFVLDWPTN